MQVSFLSLIYFIGFSHAMIMAVALWRQPKPNQSARILSCLMVVLAYKLFEGGALFSSFYHYIPHMLNWLPGAVLLIGPIFYCYSQVVAGKPAWNQRQWVFHLSPALLMIIASSPDLFLSTQQKIANITRFQAYEGPILLAWSTVILLVILKVHLATYLGSAWCILSSLERDTLKVRADANPLILKRQRQICAFLIALEIIWVVLFLCYQVFGLYTLDYVSKVWLLFMAVIILAMGYFGLKQPGIVLSDDERLLIQLSCMEKVSDAVSKELSDPAQVNPSKSLSKSLNEHPSNKEKYQLSSIPESTALEVVKMIDTLMQAQQIYLNDKLTLTALADGLNLKPHLVSQVINQTMHTTFYKLVNQYRVEHAVTLIKQCSHIWSIERIAFESGFGNRVTFNNAFKSLKGCSPSVFKKKFKQT